MDKLIRHLQVTSTSQFGPRGDPTAATQYSYYIDSHGPFVDIYPKDTDTLEVVQAGMQKRIDKLRALGALSAASY
jgi:hypothetical protein